MWISEIYPATHCDFDQTSPCLAALDSDKDSANMPSSSLKAVCALSSRNTGEVSIVVASAINTIMAKRVGEMIRKSSPTLRRINSMRPRVFISVPNTAESWLLDPVSRAATNVPPNLPSVATRTMRPQISQLTGFDSRSIRVRMPVDAEKAGKRRTVTTLSSRGLIIRAASLPWE